MVRHLSAGKKTSVSSKWGLVTASFSSYSATLTQNRKRSPPAAELQRRGVGQGRDDLEHGCARPVPLLIAEGFAGGDVEPPYHCGSGCADAPTSRHVSWLGVPADKVRRA